MRWIGLLALAGCVASPDDGGDAAPPSDAATDTLPADGATPDALPADGATPDALPADGGIVGRCPRGPADGRTPFTLFIEGLADDHWAFAAEVTHVSLEDTPSVELTADIEGATRRVNLHVPRHVAETWTPGRVLWLEIGMRNPFWTEGAAVVRDAEGGAVLFAGVDGGLHWLGMPPLDGLGVPVAPGRDCPRRADACSGDQVDHEVTVGDLSLFPGEAGPLVLDGAPFEVRLDQAQTLVGEPQCTDQPGSWLHLVIQPPP